ncbi:MAG: hypothetical protein MRY21_03395 [Simkaniaceae bacterium]|nr:hypothetical protein [Simkaniaceae bacterium]
MNFPVLAEFMIDTLPSKELLRSLREGVCVSQETIDAYLAKGDPDSRFTAELLMRISGRPCDIDENAALTREEFLDSPAPDLLFELKQGVLSIYYGLLKGDLKLLQQGLEVAALSSHLFQKESGTFLPLWVREEDYRLGELLGWGYLIFYLSAHLGHEEHRPFSDTLLAKIRSLSPGGLDDLPTLIPLLLMVIDPLLTEAPSVELPKIQPRDLHVNEGRYLTLSGVGTGLGAMVKEDVTIVSFGPQIGSLGSSSGFGIYNFFSADFERNRGWVRLVSPDGEGSSKTVSRAKLGQGWMHVAMDARSLKVRFVGDFHSEPLYFVFYVNANKAHVDQKVQLLPDSLDRYDGRASRVRFEGVKNNFVIETKKQAEIELIPLAGQNFFWGADFLLAYRINYSEKCFEWLIN